MPMIDENSTYRYTLGVCTRSALCDVSGQARVGSYTIFFPCYITNIMTMIDNRITRLTNDRLSNRGSLLIDFRTHTFRTSP